MQKEGRALIYSQIAVNDGKGQRLQSKDSHDTEAVLDYLNAFTSCKQP